MTFSSLLIKRPNQWATVTKAVMALACDRATDVRCVGKLEELSDAPLVIDIVVMPLEGAADYALEIYWKGLCSLADDTVGMYLADTLQAAVIVADHHPSPYAWLRLMPNGVIDKVDLDIEKLDQASFVAYKVTAPPTAGI